MIEAVEKAEGPCTMISDHEGIVRIAQQGGTPHHPKPVGDELLLVATAGESVQCEWRRDQTLGQSLAHQVARGATNRR
jgi:hypothetical protein